MSLTARTVLVTGASRGLGLEYVTQLVKLPKAPEIVVAACRDPASATKLQAIAKAHPTVKVVKLDVEKDDDIESAFKETKSVLGDRGLTLLINNAGIYDSSDDGTLNTQTRAKLQKHFDINVSGPVLITQKFLPLIQQAASQSKSNERSFSKAGILMMTSIMGSQEITAKDGMGSAYHYKCSKSALDMAMIMLSREMKDSGILVAAIHPGWVRTDMGSEHAPTLPEESINGCLKVIGGAGDEHHGKILTYEGQVLPY